MWALLSDLEAVQHYNPTVRAAAVQGSQRAGVGATRACDLKPKGRVVERVTHWEQELEYKVKFGPAGWLLDRLVMKRKLTATLDDVFAALVKHAENGK